MNEVLLFVNPIAGRGKGRGIAGRIAQRLARDGMNVRSFTKSPSRIEDSELCDAIAAITVGGDGTLRAAAERLLKFSPNPPPLLVVALGTANLMSRHLGIEWDEAIIEDQIAAAIQKRQLVMLDAARANGRLFLLMAGVGLDATVVHELDKIRRGAISYASYAMPILFTLGKYDYPKLTVEVDGKRLVDEQPAMAFVGNAKEYGTGFPILTHAKSGDRLLDICVLPCRTRADVLRLAMLTATGDHLHEEGVMYVQGKSVKIDSPQPVPVQIDGDAAGHTPLAIELLESQLAFIVP